MKKSILFLLVILSNISMSQIELAKVESAYEKVNISSVKLSQNEMYNKIQEITENEKELFRFETVGKSFLEKDIQAIFLGKGSNRVFLWSQMHGDEPTATLAILDLLSFFAKNKNDKIVKRILEKNKIIFLPMLNPDGAELFTRRNAQDIDINRDALRLQTPEARILKGIIDKYRPDFGFNLHDQDPYFAVGETDSLVSVALLAPAIDDKNTTNSVRKRAKQITIFIHDILSQYIPGHISKYDDEFEKRAFGDNIQLWGTSTILIESGGWYNDPTKEKIRKLNFIAIISALYSIAEGSYTKNELVKYDQIPFNKRNFYDLIIRNANMKIEDKKYICDLAINYEKDYNSMPVKNIKGRIIDMGDLSTSHGIEEFNAEEYELRSGAFILLENPSLKEVLKKRDSIDILLKQGITSIISEVDANLVGIKNNIVNLFFLNSEKYNSLRMMLNPEQPIIPRPEFLARLQDKCNINPFISRDRIKMNKYADLILTKNDEIHVIFVNGIKIYENGKVLENNPGIIYLDK